MAINSVVFLLYLAVVATVYFLLPQKFQNAFLLLASYVFYFWSMPLFGILMPLSTAVSYGVGRGIASAKEKRAKRSWLVAGIVFNLAILMIFKYFYGSAQVAQLTQWMTERGIGAGNFLPSYAAPLGIGFYTLQIIGYNADVYRSTVGAEKNVVRYALFVGFFAHITSGPIGRAPELLPQFKQRHRFDYGNLIEGCQRFLTGAFKKVVVGDALGLIVNGVYKDLEQYTGLILIVVSLLFVLQLYCDFSGYTDMALGAAKILGFTLRENFNAPYLATSMDGLWRRWHMSLTSWLRDYVYFPLGGSRKGFGRKLFNIGIVFLVSGLWHGNTASYILWGLFHGLFRIGEELWGKYGPKRDKPDGFILRNLKRVVIYVLWALSFITFKAETFGQLKYVFTHMFRGLSLRSLKEQVLYLVSVNVASTPTYYLLFFGGLLAGIFVTAVLDRRMYQNDGLYNPLSTYRTKPRWLIYWIMGLLTAMFYLIILTATSGSPSFLYAQY